MNKFFMVFWVLLIFGSIAWYGILVFLVGFRGGRDIKKMISRLDEQNK